MNKRIMNEKEFYDRIKVKYPTDNIYNVDDFKRFIEDNYFNKDYQPLYDDIVFNYQYKTLPSVKFVKDILAETGSGKKRNETKYDEVIRQNNEVISLWSTWDLPKIMGVLIMIEGQNEMNDSHKLFWSIYGELRNEDTYMIEKEYSIEGRRNHLNNCLDCIKKSQPFITIIEKERFVPGQVFNENQMKEDLSKPRDSRSGI